MRAAHPLARRLIERLGAPLQGTLLEIGTGNGRNRRALLAAGFDVTSVERIGELPEAGQASLFAAALSTHAFLHGRMRDLAGELTLLAAHLAPHAPFFATFGSTEDARHGVGTCMEANVYAPTYGDEAGVPHAFFDEVTLRRLLAASFFVEALERVAVDAIAGRWAHTETPLRGAVHWFVQMRRI